MSNLLELSASGTSKGLIRWINVKERVPEDRRYVLAWGTADPLFGVWERKPRFLGVVRYNPAADDGTGRFDCEHIHQYSFLMRRVTHWAEIVGPV